MRWLTEMARVPTDVFRTSLALIERAQRPAPVGLTLAELSRTTGLSRRVVLDALDWLKTNPSDAPFMTMRKVKQHHRLVLNPFYVGEVAPVLFSYRNTDETRLAKLEHALRKASAPQYSDRSGLTEAVSPAEALLIEEIERVTGKAITLTDAFYLGKLIRGYGVERVQNVFRQQRAAKEPLRACYAILERGARGKSSPQSALREIHYPEL